MAGDTIFARLKVIGAKRFQRDMDDTGKSTEGLRDSQGRLRDEYGKFVPEGNRVQRKVADLKKNMRGLEKGTMSLGTGLKALLVVAAVAGSAQGLGVLVQAAGAGIVALGALGVAAIGAGAVLGGFAMGAASRFKQTADVGGTAANDLKTRFGEFKTLLSDELGPAFDPVFGALAGALGPLGRLVRDISPAFAILGESIATAITESAGLLESFGPGLSTLLIGVSRLVPQLARFLVELFGWLLLVANTAMPYLIEGLTRLTDALSGVSSASVTGAIATSFQTLGAIFETVSALVVMLTPLFLALAAGIGQISDGSLPGLLSGLQDLGPAFEAIVASGALQTLASAIGTTFSFIARVVSTVITELQRFGLLKPVIIGLAAAFIGWSVAVGVVNVAMALLAANPIVLLIAGIAALAVGVVYAYRRFEGFRNVVNTVWGVIKSVFGWISDNWPLLLSILTGPIGAAVIFLVRNFGKVRAAASSVVTGVRERFNSLVSFFSGLPGRISGAVSGLFDGIKNSFRSAVNWIISKWNNLSFSIGGTDLGPFGHLPEANLNTPDIPLLAEGGTVKGIGSWITGEAGPELNSKLPNGDVRVEPLGKPAVPPAQSAPRSAPANDGGRSRARPLRQPIILQVGRHQLAAVIADIYDDVDAGVPT